jgi:hypothetical protein
MRIPNDLLVLVFLATIPHIRSSSDIKSLSRTQAPLNISQVCRYWRNVVLATPQLWAQVHFDIRTYELFSEAAVAATALPNIIPRSAHCPLDLKVILSLGSKSAPFRDSPTEGDWSALASTVLRTVIPAQRRWRRAMVVAPRELWQEGFDDESEWRISELKDAQELRVGVLFSRFEGLPNLRRHPRDRFMLDISSAKRLERLTVSLWKSTIKADSALPKLRSFHAKRTFDDLPLPDIFQALGSSPALEDVCWSMSAHSESRLANLRSLALHYRDIVGYTRVDGITKLIHVLDKLTLPQLSNFDLDVDDGRGDGLGGVLGAVRGFFVRSMAPIISLTLKDVEEVDEELINCLTSVPRIDARNAHD